MDAIMIKESLDVMHIITLALLSIILLLFSAMTSGSEVAFFSLTRGDMEELEGSGSASSQRVLDLLANPDRLLATILVTNNMVNICLVITVTQLVDAIFIFSGVWEFVFNTVIITFLLLLFG
jgi:Mg2+/Co2+ transporter CorB